MTTTIGESFRLVPQNALPQYPATVTSTNAASQYCGSDASRLARVEAPYFATPIATSHWTDVGLSFISPIASLLDNEFLPRREDTMHHAYESDVVRSATLHLIHPINQALSASHDLRGKIRCQTELTWNGAQSKIIFSRDTGVPGAEFRIFAGVEFQKRIVIDHRQFRAAEKLITGDTPITHHIRAALQHRGGSGSFFVANSRTLMRQAASYALNHNTKYVALFNWDCLVLVRFVQLDQTLARNDRAKQGVGDYCETTVIPYNTSSHMRAALLGFLVEAYKETPL